VPTVVVFPKLAVGGLLAIGTDWREYLSYSHCESSLIDWGDWMLTDVPIGAIGGR
jgi:tRNA G46 methylase TrmB